MHLRISFSHPDEVLPDYLSVNYEVTESININTYLWFYVNEIREENTQSVIKRFERNKGVFVNWGVAPRWITIGERYQLEKQKAIQSWSWNCIIENFGYDRDFDKVLEQFANTIRDALKLKYTPSLSLPYMHNKAKNVLAEWTR